MALVIIVSMASLIATETSASSQKPRPEWWLQAHFDPTEKAVALIPAKELASDWTRALLLTEHKVAKYLTSEGDPFHTYGFKFDVEVRVDSLTHEDRIATGVYQTKGDETGRFILVLEPTSEGNGGRPSCRPSRATATSARSSLSTERYAGIRA
jgi:hypothetical protein